LNEAWTVSQQAEAVIYAGAATAIPVDYIRDRLGIPCYQATLQPLLAPTRCFAHPNLPPAPGFLADLPWLAHRYNWGTHLLLQQLIWQPFRRTINQWRQETLALPPLPWSGPYGAYDRQQLPCLHGYSAHLAPPPSDWPPWQHTTGYWFLPSPPGWQPPTTLLDFLEAGPPPVYVGFGSMSSRRPEQMAKIVLEALAQTGQRGILVTGWGGLNQRRLPPTVLKLEAAPHDWLLPRVAVVIHHGGAGTTAAGARAGVPSIIIPFFMEQAFWAERIAQLRAGLGPLPRWGLTASDLAGAIQTALHDQDMREQAAALGYRLRAEDGVGRAVQTFHDSLLRS
jgi:UDP:flavonoid glycosyltransferase YjiC (YdhE family)